MNHKNRFAKKLAVIVLSLLGIANVHAAVNINYVVNNHLGAPVLLVDENQHVVWQAEYDEFGKATILVEEVEFNVRFPGQYYDKETGLTYNYYRDYDEGLGRYVQSDPIGLRGGINTYGYVEGNPVSYVDPFGLYQCVYSISQHTMTCNSQEGNENFSSSNWVDGNNTDPNCPNCQNNPDKTDVSFHGPTPQGLYNIGDLKGDSSRRPLTPIGHDAQGRTAFQTHGCANPATCSEGCAAATTNATRDKFNNQIGKESKNNLLIVD